VKDLVLNILNLRPVYLGQEILLLASVLWVVLVAMSMWGLASLPISGVAKVLFAVGIIAVPLLGLFVYTLYSLRHVDFSFLGAGVPGSKASFKASQSARPDGGVSSVVVGPLLSRDVPPSKPFIEGKSTS